VTNMKQIACSITLSLICFSANAYNQTGEISSLETEQKMDLSKTINQYFKARKSANLDLLKQVFSNKARLTTLSPKGLLKVIALEEYLAVVARQGKVSAVTTIDYMRIDQNMAFAKITFEYTDKIYIDHLTLIRVTGEWRIIHKSFENVTFLK